MLVNKKKLRKVAATVACLAGMTMFAQAQTPVTIDVSTLGGTDANNNAASTESNWQYNASQKRLYLRSANGNYTLTGTNADLCLEVTSGATNANVTFNGLNTKGVTTAVGCYLNADGVTITLIGDNYLEGTNNYDLVIGFTAGTITSTVSGKLTAKGASYGITFNNSAANFIIDGNANVSVGGTNTVFVNFTGNIKMSDAAKFTIANNTGSARTQKFEKYVPASTYEWKLTNATTTNPLTDAIINVSVAAGQTGTVERVNPVPVTYTITATAGTGGSISPSGNITVNTGTDQTFTFTANSGYQIDQVLIDDTNNPAAVAAGSYTFINVTANHKIEVSFKPQTTTYNITATAGTGGSISPSGNITVNAGTDQTFTFSANSGYEISQVLIDDTNNPAAVAAGNYTFTNIQANHKIEVYFSPITGISEATAEKMTIYPNPTNGQLRVSGDILDNKDREIWIYNVVGQVVFTSQLSNLSPETTIDISHLANGLYFLKVGGKVFKVIKE